VNHSSGTLTGGFTTVAPVYQNYAPSHASGKHWIDFNTGLVKSSDGSTWTQRQRVFVGTATTDGTKVTAVSIYPYNDNKGTFQGANIDTDGTFVANSDSKVPTQKAVKTYVDTNAGGGGALGLGNFINSGLGVIPGTGLQAVVGTGDALISDAIVEVDATINQTLLKRRAQLLWIDKTKATGVISCQYPAYNDANTVVRYDMNHLNGQWIESTYYPLNATVNENSTYYKVTTAGISGTSAPTWPGSGTVSDGTVVWTQQAGAGTIVPNSASAGVANDLSVSGTVSQVDGRRGYARQGNGSTGYLASANYTNFPTGAAIVSVLCAFKAGAIGTARTLWSCGPNASYTAWLSILASGNLEVNGGAGGFSDTSYTIEANKEYTVEWQYDGTTHYVFVNGTKVWSAVSSSNFSANNALNVFRKMALTNGYSADTIHYVELRNALRTPAQIATVAQQMLIPCAYKWEMQGSSVSGGDAASYPKENAFNSTEWRSTQSTTGVSGAAYIGVQNITSAVTGVTWENGTNGITSVKAQYQVGSGAWTDISTHTVSATGFNTIAVSAYTPGGLHNFRLLANANPASGNWGVKNLDIQPIPTTADIRSVLPADSMAVGYTETSATVPTLIIDGSNPSGATPCWAYGIRVGPRGCRNKRKFLGWQYFSGTGVKSWINPFDTRKCRERYVCAEDAVGRNETLVSPDGVYGGFYNGTSATPFAFDVASNGAARINGVWKTSGYIGCYAEILDEEAS
jgi:hypothetical protein